MSIELQDRLYTSTQVADILGVSLRTLYRYMEDGRIQSMRTASGRHRFTKDQILEFLNANGGNVPAYEDDHANQASVRAPQVPQGQYPNQNFDQYSQYGNMNQNQVPGNQFNNSYQNTQQVNSNPMNNQFGPTKFTNPNSDFATSQPNQGTQTVPNSSNLNQYGQPVGQYQQPSQFGSNQPISQPTYGSDQTNTQGTNLGTANQYGTKDFTDLTTDEEDDDFIIPSTPTPSQYTGNTPFVGNQSGSQYDGKNSSNDFYKTDSLGNQSYGQAPSAPVTPVAPVTQQQTPASWNSNYVQPNQPSQNVNSESNLYQNPSTVNSGSGSNPGYGYQTQQPTAASFQRPVQESQPVELRNPTLNVRYYRSDFTDLIDLAKKIKNAGMTRDLEYAFTLYAGSSLHTPIDPFTILHFYANPEDMQIWKDELRLSPVQKREDSNIGIIVNTDIVFVATKEIGGFKVVDDKILLKDLNNMNEIDLAAKLRKTFGVL